MGFPDIKLEIGGGEGGEAKRRCRRAIVMGKEECDGW
jgi:hypothetical protein